MFKNIPAKSILVIGAIGVLVGFVIVGGFNTFANYTSTIEFCGTTCHEMNTVYEEYKRSSLYKNNGGFRVTCAECHVPKPFFAKLWRKMMASREIYHKAMGTIDTPEKFEAKRLILAQNEWERLRKSDSRECRDCHFYEAMTIDTQPGDARFWHPVAMEEEYTCIDCHKGYVHQLPDLKGEIKKAAKQFQSVLATDTLNGDRLYVAKTTNLHSGPKEQDGVTAELAPGTPLTVLQRDNGWFRVRIQGRQYQSSHHILYSAGDRMVALAHTRGGSLATSGEVIRDQATGLHWQSGQIEGWISSDVLTGQISALWDYGRAIYQNECVRCHILFPPSGFWATEWKNNIYNMRRKTDLGLDEMDIMLKYLQHHAKPQGTI
uniref:Cytochrome c-type protein n=1 Tax=Candidatus Kentrum sp. MB TaxID=2138164 RepID=A0A450XM85_9GAMM|nr:MAG: trimethylamine-N-oxide reductase (cytochrome c), cytochrome c-type subunit TorC [Candidatus Kentron sp. MB]